MKKRDDACKYSLFKRVTEGLPRKLYGNSNINDPIPGGPLQFNDLLATMRNSRVFFYTCTFPAQYTMAFMEAWMTGMPVVAIGKSLAGFDIESRT